MSYNRKQEIVQIAVEKIKPYPGNPRINEQAVPALMENIRKMGFRNPLYLAPDLTIIAGHTRLKAARALGMTEVDCIIVSDLTEAEMREMRLSDNRLNEFAKWDLGLLSEEIEWLEDDGADLEYLDLDEFEVYSDDVDFSDLESRTSSEKTEEYQEFVDKFKPKSTTDDCFTPPAVYEAVKDWAMKAYNLEGYKVIRPFYPGGDYTKEEYPKGSVVIDNPPFSINAQILDYYTERDIPFFLFGPHLTMFTTMKNRPKVNAVILGAAVTYDNGAIVSTSFYTNMGEHRIISAPDLCNSIEDAQQNTDPQKRYDMPPCVQTSAKLGQLTKLGAKLCLDDDSIIFVSKIDALPNGLYGGGILMNDEATLRLEEERKRLEEERKRLEEERKRLGFRLVLELSDREKTMIEELNRRSKAHGNA